MALYGVDGGFFITGGAAGRRGDFLTSPEVGPLFGAVIARAVDSWWQELGRPDPFFVVEVGAGVGTLARDVLAVPPRCAGALRYVLVERSALLRDHQGGQVALEPPSAVLGPAVTVDQEDSGPVPGTGPLVTSLERLPGESFSGVILANELLDNLPVVLLERRDGSWLEVRVGAECGRLVEVLVPAQPQLAAAADRFAPDTADGGRLPLQREAASWVRRALGLLDAGRVVILDHAATTPSMAGRPWTEWLRTYRGHGRGGHPLEDPGSQDITCEVAVDQLATVQPPDSDRSQADFLRAHGVDELAEAAQASWRERAAIGDLEALVARSRVSEAAALVDPTGLGAFRVLEWNVP